MKFYSILFSGVLILSQIVFAQENMQPARYNFSDFAQIEKTVTDALLKNTPSEFHSHPEFGINPYKTPCHDCVELIHKRDIYSRHFIESTNPGLFYIQKSYFPLHYVDENGWLRAIDPRLKRDDQHPHLFAAAQQPIETHFDKNLHKTSIATNVYTFGFNEHTMMYWKDKSGKRLSEKKADVSRATVGESGVMTNNAWQNIDMRQIFGAGSVETDYIIREKPRFPAYAEWLVFEDIVELLPGYSIEESADGLSDANGFWEGDLLVKKSGQPVVKYKKLLFYDGFGKGAHGKYALRKIRESQYVVSVMVPVAFLADPALQYPVYIDPLLTGYNKRGNFFASGFYAAPLAFTKEPLTCDWTITVQVPGKCELINALVDVEYKNPTALCVPPPDDPICKFSHVRQWVQGPCANFGPLACDPAQPPFVGTCTTDPLKVPGAGALAYAPLVTCIPPQCPDYFLDFTLQNQTLACQETCDSNCAAGSFFAITVTGRTIELDVEADKYEVCVGEAVRLTSKPRYGVPPYRYIWTPSGQTDTISTVYPTVTKTYIDTAYDICNFYWDVDSVTIVVKPTPNADAGQDFDICDGDLSVTIGGNPTGPIGSTKEWTAVPATASGFISNSNASNPVVTIPPGNPGSYEFILRVEDAVCFQYDTARVNVAPLPTPVIVADTTRACANDTITLTVTPSYASYQWSTGETTQSISVPPSGTYVVIVTDAIGCEGSGSSPQIIVLQPVEFSVFPNITIEEGESVTFGADVDLVGNPLVDDFFWSPNDFLSCVNCPAPVATPPVDQRYYLTVTTTEGCISTESLLIRVILPDSYAIPSAFSPNNDGRNDRFYILKASGVTVKEFKVFNRWGQLLHNNAAIPWDGTFQNLPQDIGVYTYLFILQLFDGREVKEAGTVTLVR